MLIENFNKLSSFTKTDIDLTIKQTCEKLGIKTGEVMQLIRVLLSGKGSGVDLLGMMELLGKNEIIKRLTKSLDSMK